MKRDLLLHLQDHCSTTRTEHILAPYSSRTEQVSSSAGKFRRQKQSRLDSTNERDARLFVGLQPSAPDLAWALYLRS